jgi:hypothetical protein
MNTPIPSLRLELHQLPSETSAIEPLMVPIEWMRYCEFCESEQTFVARWRCQSGLIAACAKCGDKRLVKFTRDSEAWEGYT